MTWHDELVPILRWLVGDPSDGVNMSYSDARLEEVIIVAAHYVVKEVPLLNTYTVSISGQTITPDPSSDKNFINLTALKAAAIFTCNEAKSLASSSMRVSDGLSTIDVGSAYKAVKEMCEQYNKAYASAKAEYIMGDGGGGVAIFSFLPAERWESRPLDMF